MNLQPMIHNCQVWCSQRMKIIMTCKKEIEITSVTVKKLFGPMKVKSIVLEFKGIALSGRPPREQKEKEARDKKDAA